MLPPIPRSWVYVLPVPKLLKGGTREPLKGGTREPKDQSHQPANSEVSQGEHDRTPQHPAGAQDASRKPAVEPKPATPRTQHSAPTDRDA